MLHGVKTQFFMPREPQHFESVCFDDTLRSDFEVTYNIQNIQHNVTMSMCINSNTFCSNSSKTQSIHNSSTAVVLNKCQVIISDQKIMISIIMLLKIYLTENL